MARKTIIQIKSMMNKKPIVMLSLYESYFASYCEEVGIDMILIGDSMGNVLYGFDNTIPVDLEMIIRHTAAVSRTTKTPFIVADLPFLSYQKSVEQAVESAGRLLKEGGAQAVKIEGCGDYLLQVVDRYHEIGIPVMGHLGLTPQFVHQFGGFSVQGKERTAADKIKNDFIRLMNAGCFSIVLENIPNELAAELKEISRIPIIGIGAGSGVHGQVLVLHDILGLDDRFRPKFVKRYAELKSVVIDAIKSYKHEVENGIFPSKEFTN